METFLSGDFFFFLIASSFPYTTQKSYKGKHCLRSPPTNQKELGLERDSFLGLQGWEAKISC